MNAKCGYDQPDTTAVLTTHYVATDEVDIQCLCGTDSCVDGTWWSRCHCGTVTCESGTYDEAKSALETHRETA